MRAEHAHEPIAVGTVLAALAAIAFGVTTPFIQRFGAGLGPFTTAALLYTGAALGAVGRPHRGTERREAAVSLRHLPRLLAIAFFGAALARASASTCSPSGGSARAGRPSRARA